MYKKHINRPVNYSQDSFLKYVTLDFMGHLNLYYIVVLLSERFYFPSNLHEWIEFTLTFNTLSQ